MIRSPIYVLVSLCLAGGAYGASMTIVDLPATGTDAAIGIRPDKIYTHTLDFGASLLATINGVAFERGPSANVEDAAFVGVSRQGYGYQISDTRDELRVYFHFGNIPRDQADGESAKMLEDMLFPPSASVGDGLTLTLSDLKPGFVYSVRYYFRAWDADRPIAIRADGESDGAFLDTTYIDIDAGGAHYLDYTFVADDDDVTLQFMTTVDDMGVHLYGITCEEIASKGAARGPSPAPEAADVCRDTLLTWTPGDPMMTHIVYFGEDFEDVNDGSALVSPSQDANSYDPGRLEFGATYYWRVDEVSGAPDFTVHKGRVWSFTVEPFVRLMEAGAISATASSYATGQGPEKTIDRSGLDAEGLHSAVVTDMWLSKASEPGPAWIQYEFDTPHRLHQMVVWNFNGPSLFTGLGVQDVTVAYSPDGAAWSQMEKVFARAPGKTGYAYNTVVDFNAATARFVRLGMNSNWSGGLIKQYGLSEVQFLHIPVSARAPNPASGGTDVALDATLRWRAGREAVQHRVYLSTDEQAVAAGTAPVVTVDQTSYSPTMLDLSTTYFWRVDEVNQVETPAAWPGSVWAFTTTDCTVVDDFESYTDISPNRVFQTWIDGLGFSADGFFPNGNNGNGTGALVGHDPAAGPIMEYQIIHGGGQSMPLAYGGPSETTRTFEPAQDWTRGGIKTLVLFFQGAATNVPGELYVKINGTKVTYPGNADDLAATDWTQWNIDLPAAASLGAVRTLTMGVSSGQGMLYIDDIALYRVAPALP